MWDNSLNPLSKSVVVIIEDESAEADAVAEEVEPMPVSVQVMQVVDGEATAVVSYDDGSQEAYLIPVGGLNAEETSRYLNGLEAEDLAELLDIDDEDEELS